MTLWNPKGRLLFFSKEPEELAIQHAKEYINAHGFTRDDVAMIRTDISIDVRCRRDITMQRINERKPYRVDRDEYLARMQISSELLRDGDAPK